MVNKIFILAVIVSILGGFYGLATNQMVIFIPYVFINPTLVLALASLRNIKAVRAITNPEWQEKIKLISALVLFIALPGSIYLHRIGIQYDIFLHASVSFLAFVAISLTYPVVFHVFKKRFPSKINILIISFSIVIIGGFSFEGFQKLTDLIFGTQLFFDSAQPIIIDFWTDIIMDVLGAFVGLAYVRRLLKKNQLTTPSL